MPSDIKRRVNPTNRTIGNPKAINNSIKNRVLSLYIRSTVNQRNYAIFMSNIYHIKNQLYFYYSLAEIDKK